MTRLTLAPIAAELATILADKAALEERERELKAQIRSMVPGPDTYAAGNVDLTITANRRFDPKRALPLIPESVKARAEEKAAQAGDSLNTWLVKVVRAATNDHAINVDIDLSSVPFLEGFDPFGKGKGNRRMTGWL